MRSPAAAIAWEFRHRHRWGLLALAGYLVVVATVKLLILGPGWTFNMDSAERFAVVVMVPLTVTFLYVLTVFSFGLSGDVAGRQSMYPVRMFTLPVSTADLALWPMLYGSAAMATLWLATRFLAVWPSGFDIPIVWPALAAVSLLAWTQALTWMPYGLPGLRVVLAVLWLGTIDSIVLLALRYQASEPVMVAIVAPQIPLAYVAARFAIARARRGDVPDWRETLRLARLARRTTVLLPRRRDRFPSAARAQRWFEWRLHGRSLAVWVAILLPFELALLFVAGNGTPSLVAYTLCGVLFTPPFMAAFAAPRVRTSSPHASDTYAMTPFLATRPLTSAALIAAKLRMAMWSTLVTWLLVLAAIPAALTLSGTWPTVIDRAREVRDAIGTPRSVVIGLLGIAGMVVWTWKQLVQSLYVGLSGREWLIRTTTGLTLTVLVFIEPIVQWIRESSGVRIALWNAIPWILAALVCAKVSAASWIASRLQSSGLLSDRVLLAGAACWVVAVLALHALFVWLVLGPLVPSYVLLLLAILAVPLARVSAAPLALAWNRHR